MPSIRPILLSVIGLLIAAALAPATAATQRHGGGTVTKSPFVVPKTDSATPGKVDWIRSGCTYQAANMLDAIREGMQRRQKCGTLAATVADDTSKKTRSKMDSTATDSSKAKAKSKPKPADSAGV